MLLRYVTPRLNRALRIESLDIFKASGVVGSLLESPSNERSTGALSAPATAGASGLSAPAMRSGCIPDSIRTTAKRRQLSTFGRLPQVDLNTAEPWTLALPL